MSELIKVVIDRSKWGRGATGGKLLRPDTCLMCCLGFVSLACGLDEDEIRDESTPAELVQKGVVLPGPMLPLIDNVDPHYPHSDVCVRLMDLNDDDELDDTKREAQLIEAAREAGFEFEFVDGDKP